VFPSEVGRPLEHGRIELRWHQGIEVAGIPRYRIHDLRHSVATHLLAGGMQPLEAAATLGHSNAALVLQTYRHVILSSRQRAASITQDILAGTNRSGGPLQYFAVARVPTACEVTTRRRGFRRNGAE
jgi:integrase